MAHAAIPQSLPDILATRLVPNYARLRRIAARSSQRGHFTRAQALSCAVSRHRLSHLVTVGMLERTAPGLFRFVVASAPTWKDRLAGQLLKTGGVASGRTAAALFGLIEPHDGFDIMVPRRSRHANAPHHTTRDLPRHEIVQSDGLACLHPIRAIIDCASFVAPAITETMIESAVVKKLVAPADLERRARELRNSKRPGAIAVLQVLDGLHPELRRSRNEWEALVVRRVQEFGLPSPELEFALWIDGRRYILDAAWPEHRVALEFDGRNPHMRRAVFDNDNLRRNDLLADGWQRFGITSTELDRKDTRTLQLVALALSNSKE